MGGTPLLGGSWGPILQLDMENWIEFLEVLNLPYNILDFVQGPFFPDDLLKVIVCSFDIYQILYIVCKKYIFGLKVIAHARIIAHVCLKYDLPAT